MGTPPSDVTSYGVRIAREADGWLDEAAESLAALGFAVVESGLDAAALAQLGARFDSLRDSYQARHGAARLAAIGEGDLLRCPLAEAEEFLALAANPRVLALCTRMLGPHFVLNQQNGIVNPKGAKAYSQSPYHRDLPYQHFVSTRPLALNALFCLDAFTLENGATTVLPASHLQEAFPSASFIAREARRMVAPAGSFLVLDAMTFHCGGQNASEADRRAVNHLYTIAPIRQQIDLPAYLGDGFTAEPALRQLLGFHHPAAPSVEAFLALKERRSR